VSEVVAEVENLDGIWHARVLYVEDGQTRLAGFFVALPGASADVLRHVNRVAKAGAFDDEAPPAPRRARLKVIRGGAQ
jgi:hypothetical protein